MAGSFDAVIYQQNWPGMSKMLRLLSYVEGEPKEFIKNFPSSDERHEQCLMRLDQVCVDEDRQIEDAIRKVRD